MAGACEIAVVDSAMLATSAAPETLQARSLILMRTEGTHPPPVRGIGRRGWVCPPA